MNLKSFVQILFGYDIFISHRWSKGAKEYAERLKETLEKRGLDCFVDGTNLQKGESIPNSIKRAIRKSTVFVLICSDDVLQSTWIPKELAVAGETGRQIVPINISGSLDRFPLRERPWVLLKDRSRIEESVDALNAEQPSPNIPADIDRTFTSRRQRVRAIRLFLIVALVFFGISLAAIGSAGYALKVRNQLRLESERLKTEIEKAKQEAATARGEKAVAEAEKSIAEIERQTAIDEKLTAQTETKDALKEKDTAERATKRAKTELFNAKADQLAVEAATMGEQIETRPQGVLTALDSLKMRWSADAQHTVFKLLKTLRTPVKLIDDRFGSPESESVLSPSGRYAILINGSHSVLNIYDVWEGKKIADVTGDETKGVNFLNDNFFVGVKKTKAGDVLTIWKVSSGEEEWFENRAQTIEILEVDTDAGHVVIDTGDALEIRGMSDSDDEAILYGGEPLPHTLPIFQVARSEGGWTATVECPNTPGLNKQCEVRVSHHGKNVDTKSFAEVPLIAFVPRRIAGIDSDPPVLATVAHGTMQVWSGKSFETSLQKIGVGQISQLVFSPKVLSKGQRVFVTANDRTISFWSFDSDNYAYVFKQIVHPVEGNGLLGPLAFSPDGTLLASASANAVVVWDVSQPFNSVDSVLVHEGDVTNLAFIAEPREMRHRIVTTSKDGAIIVWAAKEEGLGQDLDTGTALPVPQIEKLARSYVTTNYSKYLLR